MKPSWEKRRPNRKCRKVDISVKLMKNKDAIQLLKNIMSVAVFIYIYIYIL
jgi:hypothetical protein